jgi:hypothetical protein
MIDTDVLTAPDLEPDEEPTRRRMSGRRMVRWTVILTIGILAVLAVWQEPLYAGH